MNAGVVIGCLLLWTAGEDASSAASTPFFRLRDHATLYYGPGREIPPPESIGEVALAYFGPADPAHPKGGSVWAGASLAIDFLRTKNARGKCHNVRLISYWTKDPWAGGAGLLAKGIYSDPVWAVIGGVDGETTHLAVQVAAKARIVIISPGNTDKTTHFANVPWVFSILPGDDLLAETLIAEWERRGLSREVVLLSATDHDSRIFAGELVNILSRRKGGLRYRADWKPSDPDLPELLRQVLSAKPKCLAVVADPLQTARVINLAREEGYREVIFAGPTAGQSLCAENLSPTAGEVIFPFCWEATERTSEFVDLFREKYGRTPDYLAAAGFDSVLLCAEAIERGGLNRVKINDALRSLPPWVGASGQIIWDRTGMNVRLPLLARRIDGRLEVMTSPGSWQAFFAQE
ncbi:MAG: ABC transporter substrate-binding protein [Thermoguttaceae bacterium]|nr:ABC transporter substrate-binding protein [Thermoguttaceae bacterium]MDW8077666.1 ABC transporter substrate-binding protein [Thermoguttaceae bacterium]